MVYLHTCTYIKANKQANKYCNWFCYQVGASSTQNYFKQNISSVKSWFPHWMKYTFDVIITRINFSGWLARLENVGNLSGQDESKQVVDCLVWWERTKVHLWTMTSSHLLDTLSSERAFAFSFLSFEILKVLKERKALRSSFHPSSFFIWPRLFPHSFLINGRQKQWTSITQTFSIWA